MLGIVTVILLSLLLCLSGLRRFIEPACPSCASKSWGDHPTVLQCTACGWSNAAPPPAEAAQPQYELIPGGV